MPRALPPRRWLPAILLALVLSLLAGCGRAGTAARPLTVFAAASLTEAFKELGADFTAETGIPVAFNFAGSQQLRAQLEQGADADVFASANNKEMTAAIRSGLVITGTPQVFAHNRLVVIMPKENPAGITALGGLAQPGLKLVLADKAVPVGQYSFDMLDKMSGDPAFGADFGRRVLANVVSYEQNVKSVVTKVQLGEADAGIVYATDVTPAAAQRVVALAVSEAYNQVASYPIAPLARSQNGAAAARFVAACVIEEGAGHLGQARVRDRTMSGRTTSGSAVIIVE